MLTLKKSNDINAQSKSTLILQTTENDNIDNNNNDNDNIRMDKEKKCFSKILFAYFLKKNVCLPVLLLLLQMFVLVAAFC